jgi:hypothetical protein
MTAVRTTQAREGASVRLRAARALFGSSPARRLFLDRQLAFWLSELDPAWSLTELRARVAVVLEETPDVKTFVLEPSSAWPGHRAG